MKISSELRSHFRCLRDMYRIHSFIQEWEIASEASFRYDSLLLCLLNGCQRLERVTVDHDDAGDRFAVFIYNQ